MKKLSLVAAALMVSGAAQADYVGPAPLVSTETHENFFNFLQEHCGKAYEGEVSVNNPPSDGFDDRLVMHVRKCSDEELQIPFHVGDDHSRTWILTQTGSGISLKHDHRNPDGTHDDLTMYGGHTTGAGHDRSQSFPVDQYSIELFAELGLVESSTNTWQMYIYPDRFTYRLTREGREFRVDFDLTEPVDTPPTPWGYAD